MTVSWLLLLCALLLLGADGAALQDLLQGGAAALGLGSLDVAASLLQAAADLAPDSAQSQNDLGVALRRLGDEAGALAAFDRALALDAELPAALLNVCELRGTPEACERTASWPGAWTALASSGYTEAALRAMDATGSPEARLAQAQLLASLGRTAEAREALAVDGEANGAFLSSLSVLGGSFEAAALRTLAPRMSALGYNEPSLRRLLGREPFLPLSAAEARERGREWPLSAGYDAARLFFLGQELSVARTTEALGRALMAALVEAGALACWSSSDSCASHVQLYPLATNDDALLIATDFPHRPVFPEDPVMYLGSDSVGLARNGPRSAAVEHALTLDLCTGSGVQAVVAARSFASHVVAIDISPRAVRFTKFNAVINGVGFRVEAKVGNLTSGIPPGTFDVVLANPPFVPVPGARSGDSNAVASRAAGAALFMSGGPSGEQLLQRVVQEGLLALREGGTLMAVSHLMNPRDFGTKLAAWGGGHCAALFHRPRSADAYVAAYAAHGRDPDVWRRNLRQQGINEVAEGYVLCPADSAAVVELAGAWPAPLRAV